MNYKRLLTILLCMFFVFAPQISMAGFATEIAGEDLDQLTTRLTKMGDDAAKMSAEDMDALANRLAELSKDDQQALNNFLKDDAPLRKNPNFANFEKTFKDQTEAIKNATERQAKITEDLKKQLNNDDKNLAKEAYTTLRNKLKDDFDNIENFTKNMSSTGEGSFAGNAKEIANVKDVDAAKALGEKESFTNLGKKPTEAQQKAFETAEKNLKKATTLHQARSALVEMRRIQTDVKIDDLPKGVQDVARTANNAMYSKFDDFLKTGEDLDAKVKISEESGSKLAKGGEVGGSTVEVTRLQDFLSSTIKDESQAFRKASENYLDEVTTAFDNDVAKKFQGDLSYSEKLSNIPGRSDVEALRSRLSAMRKDNLAFDKKVEEEIGGAGGRLKRFARGVKNKFTMAFETLFSAVLFMVPNIFQSAYLAQQEKAAQLSTWAKPIEYGGKVWQVPDWCINLENPTDSIPLYVQIPVNAVGDSINATLATRFGNTINQGAPTSNNPISGAIHSVSSDIWSFGSTLETQIKRYIFTDEFLKYTDVAVMYGSPSSMSATATVNIGGSEFTGQLVSLKTGQVIDGSGETIDATGLPQVQGIPLITGNPSFSIWGTLTPGQTAPASQGLKPIVRAYETLMEKMETLGIKVEFTQYADVGSGSSGDNVGKGQAAYFDTSCIDEESGAVKDTTCSCLVKEGLHSLATGLDLDANGEVSTRTVNTSGLEWNGLGTVTPIFGWGTEQFAKIIDTSKGGIFSGFNPNSVSFSGIEKVESGTSDSETTTVQEYADPDTVWAAQGCWIYLCQNTPFIKKLQTTATAASPSLTDYIVFMDEDLNIVPLMVPATVTKTYTETSSPAASSDAKGVAAKAATSTNEGAEHTYQKSELTLNPIIKYWTSLVFYNQPYFIEADKQGNVSPVMYDLKGGVYLSSELGSLAGNKKPSGVIPNFLNASQGVSIAGTYSDIFNQIEMHKAALLYKLKELGLMVAGVLFTESGYTLNLQGQNLPTYTSKSLNCFGTANQQDLFVALDNNGNPITLPNATVLYMQSLVTDITYQLDNKSNKWVPATAYPNITLNTTNGTGFSLSPLKLDGNKQPLKKSDNSYEIVQGSDSYLQNLGNWLQITNPTLDGTLSSATQNTNLLTTNTTAKNDAADATIITANQKVISYVQKQRLKWLSALDNVIQLGSGANTMLVNIANNLTEGYATSNKCYVYELNPSPSIVYTNTDYFVLVDSTLPTLTTVTQAMPLAKKSQNAKSTIVSLLTGTIYTLKGQPVLDKNGNPKIITIPSSLYASGKTTAEIIYDTFTAKFPTLPTSFKQSYKNMVDSYAKSQMIPKGPYSFGKYKVSIRAADYLVGQNSVNNNYIYFDAAQMTKTTITPEDMYVIVDAESLNPDFYDATKKQLLISLITGIAVNQEGDITNRLPASNLSSLVATLQGGWSQWAKENINRLQLAYKQSQEQMEKDQQNLEDKLAAFAKTHDAAENKEQSAIAQIIKNLQPAGAGLPVPYAGLEYDKASGNYVHPTPLNNQGEFLYLFMGTGKVYDEKGVYHSRYQAQHIVAVRDEYGVVVHQKTGKQKLGVPMMQPSLIMAEEDMQIAVGKSGSSLIASGSAEFPGEIVAMPKGYGLYFSKIMNTYYVLDGKNDRWMSVDGGHVYQKNGQPVLEQNTVAMSADGAPLLLYKNSNGFMQAYMTDGADYANISESNEAMTWLGLPPPFNQYSVTTNAKSAEAVPTKYTVEDSSGKAPTTYTVSKNYTWQRLVLVPIDTAGKLLSSIPDSSYQYVQLVQNNNKELTHVIYNGAAYKAKASASSSTSKVGTIYTFTPIVTTETSDASITITANMTDPDTLAPYIIIKDGTNTYKYAYVPKSYTQEEQEVNRAEIISGVTSSSPLPVEVGPMHEVEVTVSGVKVDKVVPDYVTHVLFEADLPVKNGTVQVKSVSASSVYNVPTENPEAEQFAFKFTSGSKGFGGVSQTTDNRFVYKIAGSVSQATPSTVTFDYIAKDAYVDLKTSAVYDATTGQALGQCLNMNDFLTVLDACSVNVSNKTIQITNNKGAVIKTVNKAGKNILVYRNVVSAKEEEQTIESQDEMATN